MANSWFKFYGSEWLSDPKRDLLSPIEQNCFVTILCYAQLLNDNGRLKNVTSDTILMKSGVRLGTPEYENNKCILKRFVELGMLTERRGELVVKNWKKRQEIYSESKERVKKWREKKRKESNVTVTLQSNGKNRIEIDKNRKEKKRVEGVKTPATTTREFFEAVEKQAEPTYTEIVTDLVEKTGFSLQFVKDELSKFYLYWTEPVKSGNAQRWEKQDAFEIRRRLATWFRNADKFNPSQT